MLFGKEVRSNKGINFGNRLKRQKHWINSFLLETTLKNLNVRLVALEIPNILCLTQQLYAKYLSTVWTSSSLSIPKYEKENRSIRYFVQNQA